MTAKAINVCRRVGKPSQESKKVLNKLFPSTSSSYKFNPKKESCAEKNKLKKKAAIPKGGKARIITAVLMRDLPSKVPRGAFRRRLSSEGRIAKISIRRSMTSAQINDSFPIVFLLVMPRMPSLSNAIKQILCRLLNPRS